MAQEQEEILAGGDSRLRQAATGDIVRGLLGGIPITWLACMLAVWSDRPHVPELLTRLAYPAALVAAGVGTARWTRLVTGRRSTAHLELTVVLLAVAVAIAGLTVLIAFSD